MRDSQIYAAEERVFENERQLTEIQLKKFFFHIIGDPWFINKYGEGYKLYTVGQGYSDASIAVFKEVYILDNVHFTESTLVHEQSHAVKRVRSNPHGKAWQKRYVEMIKRYVSIEKGEELAEEFRKLA
jgi:hypothetical protein